MSSSATSRAIVAYLVVFVATAGYLQVRSARAQAPAASSSPAPSSAGEVLNKYCVSCHNSRLKTAGLALDSVDLARAGDQAELWEKVVTKLRTREMPPPGRPRPEASVYAAVTTSIE